MLNGEAYLSSVIDAMGDMIRVIGKDGSVILSNAAFKKEMGEQKNVDCFKALGFDCRCEPCMTRLAFNEKKLQIQTRTIGEKVYSVTSSPMIGEGGEVSAVIESFRDVTEDHNIRQQLLKSNNKMKKDLALARRLQMSLVSTDFSDIEGFKIEAGFFPCEAVGGDMYDCISIDDHLTAYVCDVSGHGVMPAMMAVYVCRLMREAVEKGIHSPKDIFYFVNDRFCQLNVDESIYITAFLIDIDIKKEEMSYCSAGLSVAPIFFDGNVAGELFCPSNPISKWFEKPVFENASVKFTKNSRIMLYTDGFADHKSQEKMTEDMIAEFSKKDFDAKSFISGLKDGIKEQSDDLTVLIVDKTL